MTMDEYERSARRTMNPSLSPDELLLDAAAGLAEEAGEVLGLVRKRMFRQQPLDLADLSEELGDALWCIAATAAAAGLSLESVAAANIEKLRRRYPD